MSKDGCRGVHLALRWAKKTSALMLAGALALAAGVGLAPAGMPAANADDTAGRVTIELAGQSQKEGNSTNADDTPTAGGASATSASDANVNVVIREAKGTRMPLTGSAGIAFFGLFGGVAVVSGTSLLRWHKRCTGGPR